MKTVRRLIEDRLRDRVQEAKEVKGAASYTALSDTALLDKGVYVVRLIRKPEANQTCGRAKFQDVHETYAVFVATKNVRTASGSDSADENEALCDEIQAALLGWPPVADGDSLAYAGGQMVDQRGNLFIWREMYTLVRPISSET